MSVTETTTEPEYRKVERASTELRTIVQVRESEEVSWKEITSVTTVSRSGAGFNLSRACAVGRLITLVMPMPTELRAYDHNETLYPVMGLVQYCNETTIEDQTVYHVGVGFVGKQKPESFKADPRQNYRICGMKKDGLWQVTESDTQFKPRKSPRYWLAVDVVISLLKKEKDSIAKEKTVTKNISASGLSVLCSLDAKVGDRVKVASKEHDFYAIAVVRNRKEVDDQPPTLHLEFIDAKFPMKKIQFAQTAELTAI